MLFIYVIPKLPLGNPIAISKHVSGTAKFTNEQTHITSVY